MRENNLPADSYAAVMSRFSSRQQSLGTGTQSYASFRRDPSGPRITIYLSPELFQSAHASATVSYPSLRTSK